MKSLLFVPGDDAKKLAKGLVSGADVLLLDLEDSVSLDRKAEARRLCGQFLTEHRNRTDIPALFVRVNAHDTGMVLEDLAAVMRGGPSGVMLPKAMGAASVALLSSYLDALEVRDGIAPGSVKILPIITETGAAMLDLDYRGAGNGRLCGMLWGGEDLAADLGASANRDAAGAYLPPFQMARSLCLYAAAAAGVPAIDSVYTDFRDMAGLEAEAREAVVMGFYGKAAIHPAQVEPINRAFTPDEASLRWAREVKAAFDARPGAGVVGIDGRMIDRPHLRQAERILNRAER